MIELVLKLSRRLSSAWTCLRMALVLLWLAPTPGSAPNAAAGAAEDPGALLLVNARFECSEGFGPRPGVDGLVPDGWTAALLDGYPRLNSTRIEFAGGCDEDGWIERIEGEDSLVFLSQDIETPPTPGKPFDAVVFQQTAATPGVGYSLSGWMVSLCGGSFANPNDCPGDYYISKMLGVDPTGGVDPLAPTVTWVEDRRNFTESRWVNLRLGATAQSATLTVFARIRSPFRWHGNHAFVDAYSLVRAPTAAFVNLPAFVPGKQVMVRWDGVQSPDIAAIPGGKYALIFDVQVRRAGDNGWIDWQTGQPVGEASFSAVGCGPQSLEFRLRARSEQLEAGGAWPNQRYPGVWSAPAGVLFEAPACLPRAYLPLAGGG